MPEESPRVFGRAFGRFRFHFGAPAHQPWTVAQIRTRVANEELASQTGSWLPVGTVR